MFTASISYDCLVDCSPQGAWDLVDLCIYKIDRKVHFLSAGYHPVVKIGEMLQVCRVGL